ncbi:group II intron reverse transcriptase/maturase [Leptospira interrogans]|uniref:group II intron reverse transcriptase/maturase n=3 Tax=Leptospira interrogans TaxID=173 RepID=UPI0009E33925|nr:group II intron reverse transcriptase/maturase [Leptospira interrogans]
MAETIREKTDAKRRDGGTRSSEETSVMDEERRGSVIQSQSLVNFERGMNRTTETKRFGITKSIVWEAYKRIRANRGAAGIDGESIELFDKNLSKNLYKIWNRMTSGSYFPSSVRQVEIPKKSGGIRCLGVPTVSDRIAQMVVKMHLEPLIDPKFHTDSYGYRPGKSAKDAVAITRKRCWKYDWVVEFDIKGAFDNIDHDLLMRALRKHTKLKWILMYVERWLKAPFETKEGNTEARSKGTPQGGVISPLLMNLFMHYAFDLWMMREYPNCPFARYADDAVIHCRSEKQAQEIMTELAKRLESCMLMMHPDKSKIVYCRDRNRTQDYPNIQFTFLGFTFRPRSARDKYGKVFTSFLPAVSRDAQVRMRQRIREWNLQLRTPTTIEEISRLYNPVLRGWLNYYGAFYKTEMRRVFEHFDRKVALWARRKYKKLSRSKRKSIYWLGKIAKREPWLFTHWQVIGKPAAG